MKKIIFALCLAVSSPVILAKNTATQIQQVQSIFQQLAKQNMVRADFTQQKKLANSQRSFNSSGQIVFAKQTGVLWQIKNPVQADLIMTQTAIVQKTANTQSKIRLDQNQYAGIANVFLQLMSGNETALKQNFEILNVSQTGQNWQISLKPKSAMMQKLFAKIDVSGGQFVQKMTVYEKNNGSTTIQFSSQKTTPNQLSGQENALFQLAK